jgi:hypothetical protein
LESELVSLPLAGQNYLPTGWPLAQPLQRVKFALPTGRGTKCVAETIMSRILIISTSSDRL